MLAAIISLAVSVGAAADGAPTTPATKTKTTTTTTAAPTSAAPTPAAAPPLADAEAALRAGVHDRCVSLAADAIKSGRLDEVALANAWLIRGRCYVLAGDVDRAERSYAVASRISPDLVLPTEDAAWKRVKGEGSAAPSALRLVADAVVVGGSDVIVAIDVALNDDLELGANLDVFDAAGELIISAPIEREGAAVGDGTPGRVHRFSGFPVEGTSVLLRDKAGNRLRSVGVVVGDDVKAALAAAGATPAAAAAPRRIPGTLAYVGGGAMAVGLVASMVTGIQYAVSSQADETRVLDDELPWLLGFVGSVAVVAVGGGLVVVEGL